MLVAITISSNLKLDKCEVLKLYYDMNCSYKEYR
jgi:hypothetical protein